MSSHGVIRTVRTRTEEQRLQDLDKIKKYRELEDQVRSKIAQKDYGNETFQLTSKLLRLNPEYYTIWNVRRRLLISGLLSKPSDGSWPSRELPSSTRPATTIPSSAGSSSSSSTTTPPNPEHPTTGKSGSTANGSEPTGSLDAVADLTPEDGRRKAMEQDVAVLRNELGFTIPLLMEFPKCYWIWGYRSWLLQEAIKRLDSVIARRIWEDELGLCSKMLTKDRRNFHAWGYRRLVVSELESAKLNGTSMVESEFDYTSKMIRVDLSNFSAWHNRSKLIPRLLDERGADDLARKAFLDEELNLIREALNVGPEDQSLWYYHQYLILNLIDYIGKPTITPNFTMEDRVAYILREIADIKDFLEDYDDIKWIYEALLEYTLGLCELQERQPTASEKADLVDWLSKLKQLDPMRNGRWHDMERLQGL